MINAYPTCWPKLVSRSQRCAAILAIVAGCILPTGALADPLPAAAEPGEEAAIATPAPVGGGRDLEQLIRRSVTGLAMPNEPVRADLELQASRVQAWQADDTHRFLLERDARIRLGAYSFRAERIVVLVTQRELPGVTVHEVAIYLDEMQEIGGSAIRAQAERLFVTAVTRGTVRVQTDAISRDPADDHPLVIAAVERTQQHRQALAANIAPLPPGPPLVDQQTLDQRQQRRRQILLDRPDLPLGLSERMRLQPTLPDPYEDVLRPTLVPEPIARSPRPAAGQVDFRADHILYHADEEEGYVQLMGNIQLMYVDPDSDVRLNLTADNAVIFTEPGALDQQTSTDAGAVRGVYLEDNVYITDGQYHLRAPRVFYDFRTEQAVLLEAVLYTWDVQRQVPLYVRAESLRQHASNQWSATNAQLSTSEFAVPHFGIGVDRLTVTAEAQPGDAPARHTYEARGLRLNVGDNSIFYWPQASGGATALPLQRVNAGAGSRRGAMIETRWDPFTLLDITAPEGVEGSLLLDGYTQRGPGVGIDVDYDVEDAFGRLESYYLWDQGQDRPGGRLRVDPLTEHRSRTLWRHRHDLGDNWEATAEAAWLSDPTFLEEFYRNEAYADKPYETLFYLKHQEDDAAFTFLAQYDLLDFEPQLDRLQAVGNFDAAPPIGYSVHRYPELGYHRIGNSLFGDRITWHSENRGSVMQLNLPEDRPGERGFTDAEAMVFFNLANADQRFGDGLRGAGFDEDRRLRGDTRQELQAPLDVGPVTITPYAVGRVTAYDDGFEDFSGDDENLRLWGSLGVKAHTSFSRTYNDAYSDLFDINRLRHVVEPSLNLFYADTSIQQRDLPVYDYNVESLAHGTMTQVGLRNTLQTHRGEPGLEQSVDLLRFDTRLVLASDDVDRRSPIGRFFDYRPEHSVGGEFIWNEAAWQVTDTFSVLGDFNYSLDTERLERWNVGAMLDHTPRLSSFVNYRDIRQFDSALVRYGFEYLLTSKYHVGVSQSYDVRRNRPRNASATLTRRMPRWLLILTFDHDSIDDVTSAGVALAPEGLGGPARPERNPFLLGDLESRITR